MVRETRHLWVGNLPENIREDRIREHFKRYVLHLYCQNCEHNSDKTKDKREVEVQRYGRVQSVKLLPRVSEEKTGEVSMACTVAFMDIKSAAKAHNAELKIDERTLNTEYYEPAAIPSAAASPQGTPPPYSTSPGATRFPNGHGSSDEHGFPESAPGSTRFYDRSSSSGGAAPTPAPEGGSGTCRGGRNRDRFRGGGGHRGAGVWGTGYESSRYNNSNERSQSETTGYNSAPSDTNDRRNSENVRKKAKSRSGSRSPSPNGSISSRSPSRSRSQSSSSSSSSSTSRDTSSTSSPRSRRHRHHKKTSQCNSDDRRPLAICVRNLPVRSSDTSLKDGLFHEYKKHGKVTWVKIVGQNADRHAIVCFKKPEDAEKALEVSYDKLFFGCKIEVAPYSVCDIDEVEFRYESEIDEYNPKATRTLFIGNLEKDVTASDLRKHFDQFGEIIEIDIKKQGAVSSYAFCQYSDIVSVVKAIRKMDGEHLGNNRIKLGFGKSMAYNCVWIDGVNEHVNEKYLRIQFEPFGAITKCIMDREKGQALLFYEHVSQAQLAVNKMRGFVLKNTKLQVDFASRECQECFFERLEKQGTVLDRAVFEDRRDSSSRSFESTAPARISRYDTPTRPRTSSYSSRSSVAAVASPGTPGNATPRGGRARVARYYDYELDYGAMDGRHVSHRSYDEYSQGSAASHEDPYDPYDHAGYLHDSPGHLETLDVRVVQTLVEAVPYAPHDIRNLQKERVHLLEQLEECPSSGDELISPKKRLKLDLLDPTITGDVIIEANRDHNRKVMEVRRLSETTLRHHSRRPSVDNKYGHYAPHTVGCKRRRTGGSDGGTRTGGHSHYTELSDGSDHGGSRPGTPLCDENPEFPPGEPPKRTTRDREGPLMLPLPKWATQVRGTPEFQRGTISVAGVKGQKEHVNPLASPPPAATSPRVSHHHTRPPSPSHIVPPPASPPPRPPSLSSNSSDSDGASGSPSLEERIKSLDEKYEKWSGSRTLSAAGNDALALLDANREKFRLRHKLLEIQDLKEVQPSEIVKSVMAKRSVFDEDLKRLESVGEKYEPKEFGLFSHRSVPIAAPSVSTPVISTATPTIPPALKLATVTTQLPPKTPAMLSPRSSATALTIPASRGLQYPFPSHPPMQMSPAPPAPPVPPQAPPPPTATVTSTVIAAPPATSTSTSVTARGPNLGENRLKPLANVPGDARTSSVKNRSVATVISEVSAAGKVKPSEKIILRRNSSSTSPRADVKTRRNSDTSARRIDETEKCEKTKSEEQKLADKAKEELEKQKREQEEKERVEKERIEKEKQEKERLEREKKEKERLERESELEKQRLEKERLEKERIQREKEKADKERIEKEKERERLRLEKEKAAKLEKERAAEKERAEKERLEQERLEKERQEKLEKERLEKGRLERLEQEKVHQEKEEQERKQREERELREKLDKERKETERKENEEREREREREQKAKDEDHRLAKEKERRKSEDRGSSRHKDSDNHQDRSSKHRENHTETKHRENNTHHVEKQQHEKSSTKECREDKSGSREDGAKTSSKDGGYESHRRESTHENSRHENAKAQIERDAERRKESIKENRDNNIHDKHRHVITEAKDHLRDRAVVETRHMSLDLDKNLILDGSKDPNKRKERNNSLPANLGLKRRMSSHEIMESIEEPKKIKLGHEHKKLLERRESKDSSKSEDKSRKNKHKNNSSSNSHEKHNSTKDSEERRKEREREREERHKKHKLEKQKSKSKSREKDNKEAMESPLVPEGHPSMSDKDFLAKLNLRSNEDIEREKQKRDKEGKEKRREVVIELEKQPDDVNAEEKPKKERQSSFDGKNITKSPQDDGKLSEERRMQKKDRIRKMTNSSDSDSDEPKKHSIFDIVDDGPPYISMYDKVKARSCKNMQKQEEEKRQEKIKAKFSQLKLSRARREEKKRSTSWDEDSDSDKESEVKSRRFRKVLDSSDESQERKTHKHKEHLYSDSDNSLSVRPIKTEPTETTDDEIKLKHAMFKGSKSRITSDTSDDEYRKSKISGKIVFNDYHEKKVGEVSDLFSENDVEADIDVKPEKITSVKTELERLVKKERRNSKFQDFTPVELQTFDALHTEPSEVKTDKFNSRTAFDNTTDDDLSEIKKEKSEKREKKHKRKQKKLKHSASSEESSKMETDSVQSEVQEKKHHEKKKEHSKKDKKRDKTKEGREKSRKSKKNRSEDKGDMKHEGKMENIFGSLSEDSEVGNKDQKPVFAADDNAQASPVFNTDSDKEQEVKNHDERDREAEHKRRKEKKRREKERRLQEAAAEAAAAAADEPPNSNENSMDFADMGKQLEANIKDDTSELEYKTEVESSNLETSDTFAFTDQEVKKDKEDRKEGKEKKKKRKKSKDEKKHHHHHHHDKNKVKTPEVKPETAETPLTLTIPEIKIEPQEEEGKSSLSPSKPSTPGSHNQSLPNLLDVQSPTTEKSPDFTVSPTTREMVPLISPIPKTPTTSKVKRETVIPGFGTDIDETIHENAVKSISTEFEPPVKTEEPAVKEEIKEEVLAEPPEDKPRVVISQEETEDAVAALLGESFGSNQFEKRYTEEISTISEEVVPELVEEENVQDDEEMRKAVQSLEVDGDISKPDTPQSEHELQIDTDTEEQEEPAQTVEQPAKTPETPAHAQVPKTPAHAQVPKTSDCQFFPSNSEKVTTPSALAYKTLSSPPSLTLIKPQPSVLAEVRKNLEKEQNNLPVLPEQQSTQRSVIAQTWPADRKEVVPFKTDGPLVLETKQQVIVPPTSTPPLLKSFSTPQTIKMIEASYPPLAKLTPLVEPKVQTSVSLPHPTFSPVSTSTKTVVQAPLQSLPSSLPSVQATLAPIQPSAHPANRSLVPTSIPSVPSSQTVLSCAKSQVQTSIPIVPSSSPSVLASAKPQVISQLHNLPARSPVQICKPAIQEGMISPKSSGNVSLNRLPITPVMVSKPLQATTVYLPQSKIAHSTEPPKLVSTVDTRSQERPRMIFQSTNLPQYTAFPPGQPPRMLVQGNIRHLPPSGLLVPTRHIGPVGYGFMGNVPHSAAYVPLPPKEVQSQPEGALKLAPTGVGSEPIKSTIVMAGSHGAHTPSHLRTPLSCSTAMNPPHLILTSPKSTPTSSALSPRSLAPLKSPTPSQTFVAPASPRHSPKPIPVIMEGPHSSVCPSPERKSPTIIQMPPKPPTPDTVPVTPASESKIIKDSTLLPVPGLEPRRSTPSPVIVLNPEVKIEPAPPPSPVKLAIEKVTEELNMSLESKKEVKEIDSKETVKDEIKGEVKSREKTVQDEVKSSEVPAVTDSKIVKVEDPVVKLPEETKKPETSSPKQEPDKPKLEVVSLDILKSSSDRASDVLSKEDDPLEGKDDNDFWSAKDSVNIDSVIKTLGSADEMSDDENNEPPKFPNTPKIPKDIVVENKESPKTPDKKSDNSISPEEKHEEDTEINVDSIETDTHHKLEVSVTRSSSRRGRGGRPRGSTKIKISVERGGIQTRRGKLKEAEAQSVTPIKRGRGGKLRTERKSSKSESDSTTNDVYEFRDDSDDCNKEQRPRLVLTIKSTTSSTSNAQTTAIVKEITKDGTKEIGKETPPSKAKELPIETKEEFTSPQTNTRKSRRLAQKDTSRNNVDDTIEDVVKNTPLTRSASNQRRSVRQNKKPQAIVSDQDTQRKSPRGRKPSRRASEAADISSSEDTKEENPKSAELSVPPSPSVPTSPSQPKQPETEKLKEQSTSNLDPSKEKKIDHCSLKTAMLKRFKGEMGTLKKPEPTNLIDPVTGVLIPMRESEEGKYIPLPGSSPGNKKLAPNQPPVQNEPAQVKAAATEPVKTQASVIAQPHQITVVQQQIPKIHPLKAHVLSSPAAKAVVSEQPTVVSGKPPQVSSNVVAVVPQAREPVSQAPPPSPSVVVSKPSTPVLISRSTSQVTQSSNVSTSVNPQTVGPPSPRPGIPVAVTSKPQVKPPVISPSQQLLLTNQKHLLQAREQQLGQQMQTVHMNSSITPQQAQIVNTQIAHMKHRHEQQVIMGAKGPITKPPLSLHQQHRTGQIASPPVTKAQVSGRIIQGPPQAGGKGVMEPPKIDVNLPNIMLGRPNLSPSGPQARLPVPAYEASLIAEARAYYNRSSPPPAHQNAPHSPKGEPMSHFPPGPLRPPDLNPHYMHPQHMMYQQFLRQQQLQQHFQRSANLEKSGEEGEEAPVGLAVSGRGATVPHHSPHDRATESPAIGQVYNTLPHTARLPPYHPGTRYFDQQPAEPPPAHRPLTSHDRAGLPHIPPLGTPDRPLGAHTAAHSSAHLIPDRPTGTIPERPLSAHLVHDRAPLGTPERSQTSYGTERPLVGTGLGAAGNLLGAVAKHIGVDAPASQRGIQAATPPLASQVPPQAESLFMLLKQYPLMWQGLLALKNDQAAVQMYFVSGNDDVAKCSLPKNTDGSTPPLRIFQRMRLEPMQVEGVARKMQMENEHCMLLALPCGHDHMDVLKQSTNLTSGFITYLQLKQAAGIVNVAAPGTTQPPAYVVHIFPSCDFVNDNLRRIAPSLLERVADIAHLLIVITTV